MEDKKTVHKNVHRVKTPTVFQMEATECGAASLAMILSYYGKDVPLEELRLETGVSRDGVKASNIVKAAKKMGLDPKGYSYSLKKLIEEVKTPAIIHWNFNHFVVYEGKHGDYYYLNDPAQGKRKLTKEELDEGYTGIVLEMPKGGDFVKEKQNRSMLDFVKLRLTGQGASVLSLVVIGLLLIVPGLIIPICSKVFIDDILIGQNTAWFMQFLGVLICAVAFQMGLTYMKSILLMKFQNKLALLSAQKFITHLLRLPIAFFSQRAPGDLAKRVDNNNNVSVFMAGDLAETGLNIFISLFYLVLLLIYSIPLTLIGVIGAVLNIFLMRWSSQKIADLSKKVQQDSGKMSGIFYTGVSIMNSLKASGVENDYVGRILGYYSKALTKGQEMSRTQEILNGIPEISQGVTSVLVLMFGGIFVVRGDLSVGQLIAYTSLLGSFVTPINALSGFTQKIQTTKTDMARVEDILNYEKDEAYNEEVKKDKIETKLSGHVVLDKVSFGYSILEPPLIDDFSFDLPVGSSIAFVGASGSGKSTVAKVISGLYHEWGGSIKFDGHAVKNIPPEVFHASVSVVNQSVQIFAGTVRENLTMWNKHVMEVDMVQAAKDACIHDIITQKPGAYDYELSEGGSNLSGGQRQRLEIARALATNPTVLIMDEATSALDPLVEKEIIDNIKRRGCTCIIVAHRLSAIRDSDEIIVMEYGKIVQRGSHEELAKLPGHYQRLIQNT
ncbi:MAG: NHLP family bacteriocin export ABC transporter peptidase/permease/ATPase subunit [Lactobacillales bacterium]|jgi:NHLM bacteriocin system ABC transporter peptidase/ATP-binding protein|nr:NHLP family bacteriocin export ABC transporter peptidase/permease/ATPase subunit [Lactobacillales bacterium]